MGMTSWALFREVWDATWLDVPAGRFHLATGELDRMRSLAQSDLESLQREPDPRLRLLWVDMQTTPPHRSMRAIRNDGEDNVSWRMMECQSSNFT
jgi:hypothetical protein